MSGRQEVVVSGRTGRGRVWRTIVAATTVGSIVVIGGTGTVDAQEPPQDPPADTVPVAEVDGDTVAVGQPPIPPAPDVQPPDVEPPEPPVVAVGQPPVPPAPTADAPTVAVGQPPVPPAPSSELPVVAVGQPPVPPMPPVSLPEPTDVETPAPDARAQPVTPQPATDDAAIAATATIVADAVTSLDALLQSFAPLD